jgi:hypothetical protein
MFAASKFSVQPKYPAKLSKEIPQPAAVLLPSVGLMNIGGSEPSGWTLNNSTAESENTNGKSYKITTGTDGVWIPCNITNTAHKFSVLISFVCGPLVDTRGIFQWASSVSDADSPYILLQYGTSGILRVYYAAAYRLSTGSGFLSAGNTYHVVIRGDGNSIYMYAGGRLQQLATISGGGATRTHAWFGNGYISAMLGTEVALGAIWKGDIGAAAATRLANNPWGLFEANERFLIAPASGPPPEGSVYTLLAAQGTFSHSGGVATLSVQRRISAAVGSFSHSGGSATLSFHRRLNAAVGSFSYTGGIVTLTYQTEGESTLLASQGTFLAIGGDVTLRANRKLSAALGTFAMTGGAVTLRRFRKLNADIGLFSADGGMVNFTHKTPVVYRLTAETGIFSTVGYSVTFKYTYVMRDRWSRSESSSGEWEKAPIHVTSKWS